METAHDTSMRDDLNAAFDSIDEDMVETPQEIDTDESPQNSDDENSDLGGSTDSQEDGVGRNEADPTPTAEATDTDGAAVEGEKPDTRSTKAPVGWSPKEREDWSKIPPHLQKKVVARENELNTMLATTGEARKTHDEFTRLSNSFAPILNGVVAGDTPMQAVESLLNTVGTLRMGTQVEKAQTIAGLINSFGIDIGALDSMLVGEMPQNSQQDDIKAMVAEQMQPFNNMMQQGEQAEHKRQLGMQQDAVDNVKAFADTAEFLGDVRNDMADFIDMASKRGIDMPLQEAYDRACQLNPQIRNILSERTRVDDITNGQSSIQRKKNAALSISGRKSGAGAPNAGLSLRDQISANWENRNSI